MSALKKTDKLFYADTNMDPSRVRRIVMDGLKGSDGGELFMEQRKEETLVWDEGRLSTNSSSLGEGFGLRFIANDAFAYATSNEFTEKAILDAADTVGQMRSFAKGGTTSLATAPSRSLLFTEDDPIAAIEKKRKIELLQKIDAYVRAKDPKVKQATVAISSETQAVQIIREDGERMADIRPLVQLRVAAVLEKNGRSEKGSTATGGRYTLDDLFDEKVWKALADDAIRMAEVNLESVDAPAGEMSVVLNPGWPGVMLHEAVGHGLEGDFNRKGSSAFSGKVGQQVAAKGVTVIDQGDIADRRGSLNFDDEGVPTQENILIEDGVLKGYMQDRMNARLMGVAPTGNGRRQGYEYAPMPRMTTTFMKAAGRTYDHDEIIASVKDGIFAANFGGGSVDIVSGEYVFEMTEAYRIRNGKVCEPVKGATMIGNGPESMKQIKMLGDDLALDPGVGVCGKSGQGVPVGIGQPTVRMDGITVGGRGPSKPKP